MSKILITGATGFIGGFIVDEALRRNMDVWVAVRRNSSRKYLKDSRINFIEINLADEDGMTAKLKDMKPDYVVHAAGVTKCIHKEDFSRINTEGTKNLVKAIIKSGTQLKKFVYVSSLSVYGPIHEDMPYKEIKENDTPRPDTEYGKSKLEAEKFLHDISANNDDTTGQPMLNYIILRPTGVYGPREKDYFMMAKSISRHVDFAVGYKPQDLTFVYVTDVVQAIFLALDHGKCGKSYFLSDGQVYRSTTFSELIRSELGNPWWIRITAPIWVLRIITFVGEYTGRVTGKISALNNDKYNIMKQRNWRCDITPATEELGYKPTVQLQEGVHRTIKWYKENGWLKK